MERSTMGAEARLGAIAAVQHGAFTRAQACGAGYSPAQVERRVRAGAWVRVLPRVYRHAATPESAALTRWAAVLWAGAPSALSHTSAAIVWGIPVPHLDAAEITVPPVRAPRAARVVVHRSRSFDPCDVVGVHGLPVTAPARTIVDLAAVLAPRELAAALAAGFGAGLVTPKAVRARLDGAGACGRAGARALRQLLETSGPAPLAGSARMAG